MVDLKGKVALVTGAGHGIGKQIALSLAKVGADVVVTDIADTVFDVAKQIESLGVKALPLKCDVSNLQEVENTKAEALSKFQKVDILVNNAGIYPQKSFLEMNAADWCKVMRINLFGLFYFTKAFVPGMVERKYGKVINLASVAGAVVGYTNLVHYSTSKAGIVGFTKSLALEMAPYGITVNAVAPGAVDVAEVDTPAVEAMYNQVIKAIPMGRIGKPIDIAELVVFLASDESSFITGQCIVSDGGYTLP